MLSHYIAIKRLHQIVDIPTQYMMHCTLCGNQSAKYTIKVKSVLNSTQHVIGKALVRNVNVGADKKPKALHIPVMKKEVLSLLKPYECKSLLDMTFGAGGHSRAFLEGSPDSSVLALDRDPLAYRLAQELEDEMKGKVTALNGRFSELPQLLGKVKVRPGSLDAVLMDLGVSSMQLDTGQRGFSISLDGPLDMRMDADRFPDQPTAGDIINMLDEVDLSKVIKKYGEDTQARKIAHAIVQARAAYGRIATTKQLAAIVENVCTMSRDKLGRYSHPATKLFQALRIFVNNELNELNAALEIAHTFLKPGGLCIAITFHSLEDRIVKRHFHDIDLDEEKNLSLKQKLRNVQVVDTVEELQYLTEKRWKPVNKKVLTTDENEVEDNPRSRSAKLRAAIKSSQSV